MKRIILSFFTGYISIYFMPRSTYFRFANKIQDVLNRRHSVIDNGDFYMIN